MYKNLKYKKNQNKAPKVFMQKNFMQKDFIQKDFMQKDFIQKDLFGPVGERFTANILYNFLRV